MRGGGSDSLGRASPGRHGQQFEQRDGRLDRIQPLRLIPEQVAVQRARGSVNVKVAPVAEESAQIVPSWASMIPLAM